MVVWNVIAVRSAIRLLKIAKYTFQQNVIMTKRKSKVEKKPGIQAQPGLEMQQMGIYVH